ncbi:hypothetical protein ATCV1_z465L [Acanthocystis turfacea chlorella virus 1]|uniref:Uncharacterized protein z465L n=1 Tax=Chlorovirus heliozoae TaxID=322019 RepID=A7K975_9PHYC|nr:hypothetical protein ATCV1_z465L [Acanthocystis turfacea chlorella virus 1]ABT16599.1 hypothetical protein ATCV1_z465L [Acanthocystis turfacea chlorella virus 1]
MCRYMSLWYTCLLYTSPFVMWKNRGAFPRILKSWYEVFSCRRMILSSSRVKKAPMSFSKCSASAAFSSASTHTTNCSSSHKPRASMRHIARS